MRLIFLIAVSLAGQIFAGRAQDCPLIKETDPYTRETLLSTGFIELGSAAVVADANRKELDIMFSFKTDRCFDDKSMATIYFVKGKQRVTIFNGGTLNCEGLFHFIFRNGVTLPSSLKQMTDQAVSHIDFKDRNNKVMTVTLTAQQQTTLQSSLCCLIQQAASLLLPPSR